MPRTFSIIVIALSLCGTTPVAAQSYKWLDEFGRVNYGDEPPDSATDVESVGVPECRTEACRQDEEQRYQEGQERNREIQEWVDKRADERMEQAKIDAQLADAEARRAEAERLRAPPQVIVPIPSWWPNTRPHFRWPDHDRPIARPLPELRPDLRPRATLPVN